MDNKTTEILLGFSELNVTSVEITNNRIKITCHSKFAEHICPSYLKKCKKVTSVTTRRVRDYVYFGERGLSEFRKSSVLLSRLFALFSGAVFFYASR